MVDKKLAEKINKMAAWDQKFRKEAIKTKKWKGMASLDKKNTAAVKKIVKRIGWPTIKKVGKRASFNAWLLIQHADRDLNFQKRCLALMEKEYKLDPKNVIKKNIAYLTDRILIKESKKQKFGTQFKMNKKGKYIPWLIEDKRYLDKRREDYGLEPFKEYEKKFL